MPKSVPYTKGSIIYFEGDQGESLYIIQSGEVVLKTLDIVTGEEKIEKLKTGEFFGVKSALAKMPRIETATTSVDSMVVELSVPEFESCFSNKPKVTEKMLRVFSITLREMHKQMESILKTDEKQVPPGLGMQHIAEAFYDEEEYRTSVDIMNRIVEKYSDTANMESVNRLLKEAKNRAEQQEHQDRMMELTATDEAVPPPSLKQFANPVFERFTKQYKKGDVIICEAEPGETFYLIKSGKVQIVKTISGQNKNLDVLKPGEFFGEMAILDNSPRTATCVAKTDCACLEFSKENFSSLVLGNSVMVMNLLKLFCKRICDQQRRFKTILIKDNSVRLSDVFLMLDDLNKNKLTKEEQNNPKRKFDVTVGDMASWAGISVSDARDELNKMVEKHKIEIFDNYMNILNIHDHRRIVDTYYKKTKEEAENEKQKANAQPNGQQQPAAADASQPAPEAK